MSGRHTPSALSLRAAKKQWLAFGGQIEQVNATGEDRYTHPELPRPITVNRRRKDAPRKLTSSLRRLKNSPNGKPKEDDPS